MLQYVCIPCIVLKTWTTLNPFTVSTCLESVSDEVYETVHSDIKMLVLESFCVSAVDHGRRAFVGKFIIVKSILYDVRLAKHFTVNRH
jgi:hypothetical protein